MQAVRTRLDNLEKRMGGIHGPGLLVVMKAGPSDEDIDSILQERGIDRANPNHLIVILRYVFGLEKVFGGWKIRSMALTDFRQIGDVSIRARAAEKLAQAS